MSIDPQTRGWRMAAKTGLDLALVSLAVLTAYAVRLERIPAGGLRDQMLVLALALPVVRALASRLFGAHRSSWRLFGLREALVLSRPLVTVTAILVAIRLAMPVLAPRLHAIPLGVIALEACFSLGLLVGVRVVVRSIDERTERRRLLVPHAPGLKRALLVGAGRAGRMAVRELKARPDAGYEAVGFLDDAVTRAGQVIEGVPVLGTTAEAAAVAGRLGADTLILTMPSVTRAERRAVVERCRAAGLPIQTVPGLYELIRGEVGIAAIRPLRIEDLLGREVVSWDEVASARVTRAFTGKRVLVTGAGGSIGAELCRQLLALEPERLVLVESGENALFEIEQELRRIAPQHRHAVVPCLCDVRSASEVEEVFAEHRPQVVFHAAAYKHVPMMELHPGKAIVNNVRGTRVVADAARRFRTERFLLVSTDKAVNPTSVMGATKRAAEMVVLDMDGPTKFSAVRFGNVLGSNGSVVHTFAKQIEAGGPVTVTHPDITRFFMTIPEAVRLVLQAAAIGAGGDVFLLDMGEPVKILDLARQMIRLAGHDEGEIAIEVTGLRPGEKLHEELLRRGETSEPSGVPSIMRATNAGAPFTNVRGWISRLEAAADDGDLEGAVRLLASGTGLPPPQPLEETDPGADVRARAAERATAALGLSPG